MDQQLIPVIYSKTQSSWKKGFKREIKWYCQFLVPVFVSHKRLQAAVECALQTLFNLKRRPMVRIDKDDMLRTVHTGLAFKTSLMEFGCMRLTALATALASHYLMNCRRPRFAFPEAMPLIHVQHSDVLWFPDCIDTFLFPSCDSPALTVSQINWCLYQSIEVSLAISTFHIDRSNETLRRFIRFRRDKRRNRVAIAFVAWRHALWNIHQCIENSPSIRRTAKRENQSSWFPWNSRLLITWQDLQIADSLSAVQPFSLFSRDIWTR